ncbi:hypothetical protein BC834DRAFT_331572 [Gloeopeniophorella convolvens]|nr:hypothetical protein BC834DRAFT_331572 [Gloeopeniophorella convolvens]
MSDVLAALGGLNVICLCRVHICKVHAQPAPRQFNPACEKHGTSESHIQYFYGVASNLGHDKPTLAYLCIRSNNR